MEDSLANLPITGMTAVTPIDGSIARDVNTDDIAILTVLIRMAALLTQRQYHHKSTLSLNDLAKRLSKAPLAHGVCVCRSCTSSPNSQQRRLPSTGLELVGRWCSGLVASQAVRVDMVWKKVTYVLAVFVDLGALFTSSRLDEVGCTVVDQLILLVVLISNEEDKGEFGRKRLSILPYWGEYRCRLWHRQRR
jgi:hypothetical protein